MEGIELDADLEIRRKRDDYDFENRNREAQFDFDTRKQEDQFDFDTRKRDTEFEFEIDVKLIKKKKEGTEMNEVKTPRYFKP